VTLAVFILAAGALATARQSVRARPYRLRMAWMASSALLVLAAAYVALSTRRMS
jgi:hypothetical protein